MLGVEGEISDLRSFEFVMLLVWFVLIDYFLWVIVRVEKYEEEVFFFYYGICGVR